MNWDSLGGVVGTIGKAWFRMPGLDNMTATLHLPHVPTPSNAPCEFGYLTGYKSVSVHVADCTFSIPRKQPLLLVQYDRGVYGARQDAARTSRTLTYRGCGYSSRNGVADQKSGNFRYRGVSYSL